MKGRGAGTLRNRIYTERARRVRAYRLGKKQLSKEPPAGESAGGILFAVTMVKSKFSNFPFEHSIKILIYKYRKSGLA